MSLQIYHDYTEEAALDALFEQDASLVNREGCFAALGDKAIAFFALSDRPNETEFLSAKRLRWQPGIMPALTGNRKPGGHRDGETLCGGGNRSNGWC